MDGDAVSTRTFITLLAGLLVSIVVHFLPVWQMKKIYGKRQTFKPDGESIYWFQITQGKYGHRVWMQVRRDDFLRHETGDYWIQGDE